MQKVLKMDLNTKILYLLFNFFAPFFVLLVIWSNGYAKEENLLFWGIVLTLLAIVSLIRGIKAFNKYLILTDEKICLCVDKNETAKLIKAYDKSQIEDFVLSFKGINAVVAGKKEALINHRPSMISLILTVGLITAFIVGKIQKVNRTYLKELKMHIGKDDETLSVKNGIAEDVLAWIAVLLVTIPGGIMFFIVVAINILVFLPE